MASPIVFWFRRDLRTADHPALLAAVRDAESAGASVAALFVIEPHLLASAGANRSWWTMATLDALRRSGVPVVVRTGRATDVVPAFAEEVGSADVRASTDFTPYARRRDREVADRLARVGAALHLDDGPYAVPPGTVQKGDGTPFKVFTPFSRVWDIPARNAAPASPVDAGRVNWFDARSDDLPDLAPTARRLPQAGERAASERAHTFIANNMRTYDVDRDRPDLAATSRLSPDLKAGAIHPRTILDAIARSSEASTNGARVFRSELCWREFYADVLFHRPDTVHADVVSSMASMAYDIGPDADVKFAAWAEGRTGFPIVDAGMRQLLEEGWMHNRVRMIVASFLVKDLHLDWRRGAQHFLDHLFDGDIASNQHGWQWTAGTGTDAAPYFRVFNPTSQGERFDPVGDYVRRYVPELADIAGKAVHAPRVSMPPQDALFSTSAAATYPPAIVDHATERDEALRRYSDARGSVGAAAPTVPPTVAGRKPRRAVR